MANVDKANYYDMLELAADASQQDIARAYRRLARACHPDLQPSEKREWAEVQMKRLNEAYAVLCDPETRACYDAESLLAAQTRPPRAASGARRSMPRWAKAAFWTVDVGFLAVGAYLVFFKWRPILNDVLHAEASPLQWLFAILWYGLVFFDLIVWTFALLAPLRMR